VKVFHVAWDIEIKAETALDAARAALAIQRNPASGATTFDVWTETEGSPTRVNLDELEEGSG
jgi:hypothetical protein